MVGSQDHVTFVDCRSPKPYFSVNSADRGVGVRSLLYKNGYLIIGSGSGKITFLDPRTRRLLISPHNSTAKNHSLDASTGWIGSNAYGIVDKSTAIYTMAFNDDRNMLFAGGGPIQTSIQGVYAGLWQI